MELSVPELLIILMIVSVLFGGGRIAKLGGELGRGLREFRQGLSGDEPHSDSTGTAESSK